MGHYLIEFLIPSLQLYLGNLMWCDRIADTTTVTTSIYLSITAYFNCLAFLSLFLGCSDKNQYCSDWAKGGYCSQQNVKDTCPKSCGTCGGGGGGKYRMILVSPYLKLVTRYGNLA